MPEVMHRRAAAADVTSGAQLAIKPCLHTCATFQRRNNDVGMQGHLQRHQQRELRW